MQRCRVSILGLMGVIAVVALGVVGLKEGTEGWAGIMTTATALLLLGAVVSVTYGRGVRRAVWGGFALFGWACLLWGLDPWSALHGGHC